MTKSKLDTGLKHEPSSKKIKELKFTDYSISNWNYDFKADKKTKARVLKPLKNSGLKGLKLVQFNVSFKKYFIQNF